MKYIIMLLLVLCLSSLSFADDLTSPISKVKYNPDGRIGSVIFTCLAGFHTGNGDIVYSNKIEEDVASLSGYLFSFKVESPMSKSSTLILLVDLNKRNNSVILGTQFIEQEQLNITILGGLKFSLNP